ncbi:MAG: Fe-S cluster assembly ATPase SufC [Coxiellaceae bacterium]|nr:Fe-S cluster assembly ATPase SufC [Coxiellaceae bacterium]
MLSIKNLHASVDQKEILKGLDLEINPGEVHAIMGPNGSGKSTLANVLSGRPGYQKNDGDVLFEGQDLTEMEPEQRAIAGLFLGFQYPVEIPGVNNLYFLKTAYNSLQTARGEPELDAFDFMQYVKKQTKLLGMDEGYLQRALNDGFSGGEKKRNEILQMLVLNPKLAILDEIDSGLDIDALQTVAAGVNHLRSQDNAVLLVTHYQRLLQYITPDFVHVLVKGKIVKSGDKSLALELEQKGYGWLMPNAEAV